MHLKKSWNPPANRKPLMHIFVITVRSVLKSSFGAGVLCDRFGPLGHGVFGQLPGQQQPHRGLHLSAGDGGALVVLSQPGRFSGDPLEQVVHEGVHDAHGSARNPRIRMDLFWSRKRWREMARG